MEQGQVNELVSFIDSPNDEIRSQALEYVSGLTGTDAGKEMLFKADAVKFLSRPKLLREYSQGVAKNAMSTLINLCDHEPSLLAMIDQNLVSTLVDSMKTEEDDMNPVVELRAMLLCNLSHVQKGSQKILGLGSPLAGLTLSKLIDLFVFREKKSEQDPYSWVALILLNLSQIPEGRKIIMNPKKGIVPLLLPFLKHNSLRRRRGIAGMIKNCCFSKEDHDYLLKEVDIVTHLQSSLRGNEILDEEDQEGLHPSLHNEIVGNNKQREHDREVKKHILESLIVLSNTKDNRQFLRDKKVYPLIREAEKKEEDAEIIELMHNLVELIMLTDDLDQIGNKMEKAKIEEISEEQHEVVPKTIPRVVPKMEEPVMEHIEDNYPDSDQEIEDIEEI